MPLLHEVRTNDEGRITIATMELITRFIKIASRGLGFAF